ncbi:translation initiation factor eIF 4e-like domain-containing protein [Infundibulicybe gibba]|nr:translation initiation factor eIF 4e-like domain-containing protein [Infundibulicybe gibba]
MSNDANDESPPTHYPYSWSGFDSSLPLAEFLSKFKPSMVQNDGSKPWIWVRGSEPSRHDVDVSKATEEAKSILEGVTQEVDRIKNDATIPVRSNKKTGVKSKKEVREEIQANATEKLKEISQRHGYLTGKWSHPLLCISPDTPMLKSIRLIFASSDKVDQIWSSLATSLVSGPLASTSAYLAKVSTSPENETPNNQHLICVYMPDAYDKDKVTQVMKILLRNHGVNLAGVKSDLYTVIGIDSKHPSGISSTIWKNSALLKDSEAKVGCRVLLVTPTDDLSQELKDAFFADVASNRRTGNETATAAPKEADPGPVASKKPKPKKKVQDDPFASGDDDDAEEEAKRKQEIQARKNAGQAKRSSPVEDNTDDDTEERPKKRRTGTRRG